MGCLPDPVTAGKLACQWALLADPQFGYGITTVSDEPPVPSQMSGRDKLWLALREEPLFDASDEQIAAFIEDSAQSKGYVKFVNGLKDALGARCVVYRGLTEADSPGLADLLEQFSDTGLHIYGPSFELLAACADRLVGRSEDIMPDAIGDSPADLVAAYRDAISSFEAQDAEDSADGAAVNCQSLVMRVGPAGQRVLLTTCGCQSVGRHGDADGQVVDDGALARRSRRWLSHHGATNGQNPRS